VRWGHNDGYMVGHCHRLCDRGHRSDSKTHLLTEYAVKDQNFAGQYQPHLERDCRPRTFEKRNVNISWFR
jgi:hypothetical protein